MIFSVIPGIPSEMDILNQTKVFVAGACREMRSSAATAEKREMNASELLQHMLCSAGVQPAVTHLRCAHAHNSALLCWCTAVSAFGHLNSPREETRRRKTSALIRDIIP